MAKQKKWQALLVGLGNMGMGYDLNAPSSQITTHLRALNKNPTVHLIGAIDSSKEKRNQFQSITGKPSFKSISDGCSIQSPDLIVLAVPTDKHLSLFQESLDQKPKLILLEKPIATNFKDAKKIVHLANRYHIPVVMNYYLPYYTEIQNVILQIQSGKWGKLRTGHVLFSKGVNNNGSHLIHLLLMALGSPHRVLTFDKGRNSLNSQDFDRDFIFEYTSGSVHFSCLPFEKNPLGEIDLIFEKVRVKLTHQYSKLTVTSLKNDSFFPGYGVEGVSKNWNLPVKQFQKHVLNCVLKNGTQPSFWQPALEQALQTQKLVEKIKTL